MEQQGDGNSYEGKRQTRQGERQPTVEFRRDAGNPSQRESLLFLPLFAGAREGTEFDRDVRDVSVSVTRQFVGLAFELTDVPQ